MHKGPGSSTTAASPRTEYSGLLPSTLLGTPPDESGRPPRRSARDWVVDFCLFGFAVVVGVPVCAGVSQRNDTRPSVLALDVVAGLICCLALWWRRRWPVPIALIVAVAGTFSALAVPAAAITLFTVAVHRRFMPLVGVAGADLAASLVFMAVRPAHSIDTGVPTLVNVLGVIAIATSGMFTRARRQLIRSLRERVERAETEQKLRVAQARQLERTRIAREMHDVLAHRISLVSMHAGALEFRAEAVGPEVARSAAVIRTSAHQALEDLREVIDVLRTDTDTDADVPEAPQPKLSDVPDLIEEARAAGTRIAAHVELSPNDGEPPAQVGRTAYRVVQEGLTNARKHAPGAAVTVRLARMNSNGLEVEVLSRRGITSARTIPGAGQGLIGLTERTELAGGRLEHGPTEAGDFRLAAWLPWPS